MGPTSTGASRPSSTLDRAARRRARPRCRRARPHGQQDILGAVVRRPVMTSLAVMPASTPTPSGFFMLNVARKVRVLGSAAVASSVMRTGTAARECRELDHGLRLLVPLFQVQSLRPPARSRSGTSTTTSITDSSCSSSTGSRAATFRKSVTSFRAMTPSKIARSRVSSSAFCEMRSSARLTSRERVATSRSRCVPEPEANSLLSRRYSASREPQARARRLGLSLVVPRIEPREDLTLLDLLPFLDVPVDDAALDLEGELDDLRCLDAPRVVGPRVAELALRADRS